MSDFKQVNNTRGLRERAFSENVANDNRIRIEEKMMEDPTYVIFKSKFDN